MEKNKNYDPAKIEAKWQKTWEKKKIFQAQDSSKKPKFYGLIEFPYPSGDGLHVGHIRSNTAMDVIGRKRRMEGYNVLYPIGWDAFGLPTENYAIKTGISPEEVTKKNTGIFRRQLKSIGFSFDWSREVNTTDPKYFKWTQWIFLQLLENNLAYKAKIDINWCPKDKIGLANEEVVNGKCERCGTTVEKREKEQWMLDITKYADKLDKDLDKVDYLEKIKIQQRNWIGKSEGAELEFKIKNSSEKVKVFTTRADTLFGATYMVLAPEHELVQKFKNQISNWSEVEKYIKEVKNKTEIERTNEEKEKTGAELKGVKAINPTNGEKIPIFIADYVLGNYGTGAVMAVPAHDDRDFAFAKKYNLPIKEVIAPFYKTTTGQDAVRSDKPTIKRRSVFAIVKHWQENKYLCLDWNKFGWHSFIIGGVENGEKDEEAVLREVVEESGYQNSKIVKKLPGEIHSEFFAGHKDVNRYMNAVTFYLELKDGEKKETDDHEKQIHIPIWIEKEKVEEFLNLENHKTTWRMLNKPSSFTDDGILIGSGEFDGLTSEEAREKITAKFGKKVVKFKLRDWVFSRQRYWGEPIPVVHCEKCGIVALKEKDLPLRLPKVKNYQPTDTGESPLAAISKWVDTKCPRCGGKAKRETDTMPNWAGSSWYFLRYVDPKNGKKFADFKKLKYFTPVDWYNGGMEHTTLHLLYSRFWHKFLYDLKLVPTSEPYKKRTSHGMILASNGEKMSKSRGNVINPDSIVKTFGADTLRVYEMFMGPFDQAIPWGEDNIVGVRRFLERVWKLQFKVSKVANKDEKFETILHKTVKKVTEDIESMGFNTAISAMMILTNEMDKQKEISKKDFEMFLKILSPFAPHIAEEIWSALGNKTLIALEKWPKFDNKKIIEEKAIIMVQVNGRIRAQFEAEMGATEQEAKAKALSLPDVQKWLAGGEIKKVIFVQNKIINFVV